MSCSQSRHMVWWHQYVKMGVGRLCFPAAVCGWGLWSEVKCVKFLIGQHAYPRKEAIISAAAVDCSQMDGVWQYKHEAC